MIIATYNIYTSIDPNVPDEQQYIVGSSSTRGKTLSEVLAAIQENNKAQSAKGYIIADIRISEVQI